MVLLKDICMCFLLQMFGTDRQGQLLFKLALFDKCKHVLLLNSLYARPLISQGMFDFVGSR